MIELRGSTWDHARGYDPLEATARQYLEAHPGVGVTWERRTLREFSEASILDLAERNDLIVLDHPSIGAAVAGQSLLPLDGHLSAAYLADQAAHSVGKSHASYQRDGRQWALAVDAAGHVSAYRPDLLADLGARLPRTWDDVFALGRQLLGSPSSVAVPLMHVDCVTVFITLCANLGEPPMQTQDCFVSRSTGRRVLEIMRKLRDVSHRESLAWNPPQMLDRMAEGDEIAYCPLTFGYSNYARPGFRRHLVRFGSIPLGADGKSSGAILGGAGLAVSRRTRWPREARDYAAWVASPAVQRGIYFTSGGQPGHRLAWLDPQVNETCSDFFKDTLDTLDNAYLRPTYDGYVAVQDAAAMLIHQFLRHDDDPEHTLDQLDTAYRQSLLTA